MSDAGRPEPFEAEPRPDEGRAVTDRAVTDRARGGLSLWSILSGVLVAFGAFVVLSAIVGAILIATGVAERGIQPDDATAAGIGAGIGLIVAQLLAYLWGGYAAGRMARGSGALNGLLVPIVALVVVAILGGILAAAADADAADVQRLPLPLGDLTDIAAGVGIALLVVMLLGGVLGGMLGARWHTKLEDREAGL